VTTNRLYQSRTLVIPDDSYINLYGIFFDINTGDMFDKTTGAVTTTWTDAAVVAVKHASNKGVWLATTPPITVNINLGLNFFDAASPANTDAVVKAVKYDPKRNISYTDATPAAQGQGLIR
jgi:hypothetical protein